MHKILQNHHLSRIWKLTRFTHFIRKVFATKILLSGKFSLFVTLNDWYIWFSRFLWFRWKPPKNRNLCYIIRASSPHPPYLPDLCQLGIPTIDKLQSMVHLNKNVNRIWTMETRRGMEDLFFLITENKKHISNASHSCINVMSPDHGQLIDISITDLGAMWLNN